MTIAIVILNWNGEKFLKKFLPILIANTKLLNAEIIVADNASTDTSLSVLRLIFPTIRTIVLDKNYGFAGGYNRALEQVNSDYYVLLNSDIEVTPNWLEPLISYMEEHKTVAACQPKIRSYHRKTHFEHAGAAGGYIDRFGFPFCKGRIFNEVEEDRGQYDTVSDIFWATGACLVVKSEQFWKVGGFDDKFFAHMEEIDLCWRLKSRGFGIVCIPQSVVYHIGGGTLKVESPYKTYLNFRNNLLLLYKNLPPELLKKTMFWRFIFDYSAVFQFILAGKIKNAQSICRARYDYKKMRREFTALRNNNLSNSKSDNKLAIYQKSIVLEFFLKRKKTYNSLYK